MATCRARCLGGLLAAAIAALAAAPAAGQCVGRVKIERSGPLGPGISLGGPVYAIEFADTPPGGRPFHYRLSHSGPPDRICVGQPIEGFRILAENLRVDPEARSIHRAAAVTVGFDAAFNIRMTCTARPPLEAKVAAYEAKGENVCTGVVTTVPRREVAVPMVWSSFAMLGWHGRVAVYYATED